MSHNEPMYQVVLNEQGQYSIWLSEQEPPLGWRFDGFSGSQADCLAHVEKVWTDMRPAGRREPIQES